VATTFERLAQLGIERLTLCLDRDGPGRAAATRAIERAVSATRSPQLLILDPSHLAPAKDPDEFVRQRGEDAWTNALSERECGIVWRAEGLTKTVSPDAPAWERRGALARAGAWLGTLPPRLALEQEDAVRAIAERCGYSPPAVERAFQARYWNARERELGRSRATGIER
jgi:DNA primase